MLCGDRTHDLSRRMRCYFTGVLIVAATLLTGHLLQIQSSTDWEDLAVAAIGLGSPLGYAALSARVHAEIKECCWILMLGYVGMSAGLAFDAKGAGFDQLLALCRTENRDGLSALADPLSRMPAAYVGMGLACLAAAWLPPPSDSAAVRDSVEFLRKYTAMALGMAFGHWAGMTCAESLPPRWFAGTVLLSMVLGMAIGDVAVRWKGGGGQRPTPANPR
jgi:hypothetical protein